MSSFSENVYSVAAIREIDRRAIEEQGVSGYTLMTRAGEAAVRSAHEAFPNARRWQVLCGGGNNGGDGYVIARVAMEKKIDVSVIALVNPNNLQGDAAQASRHFVEAGGQIDSWAGKLDDSADLLVDAILGSGLTRSVSGSFAWAVAAINAHPAKVHAIDIATGINGDSGEIMGTAIQADLTTTFVGLKTGLLLGDGRRCSGEITVSNLDIADCHYKAVPVGFRRVDDDFLVGKLPPRSRTAHKGDFGHVLVVGGGPGMPGAACLCGKAALRAGAGRVSIATDPAHAASIATSIPELMAYGVSGSEDLRTLMRGVDVIAFGPGLGRSSWAEQLYDVLKNDPRPSVWDADALNWLAKKNVSSVNRVITPHPGEAANLLQATNAEVQLDRPKALRDLAAMFGGTVLLKGAGTLISNASGVPILCASGNPGMAAPGMGDALTGIIAAFMAQGLTTRDAAVAGVEVHARAGDAAAAEGERGMTTSDLIGSLRSVVNP